MSRPAGMLVIALALALLSSPPRVGTADPGDLSADSEIVFAINVKQILGSDLVKAQKETLDQLRGGVQKILADSPQVQRFLEKSGFDSFKDLGSITVGMPADSHAERVFVLIEGNFNVDKIRAAAEAMAQEAGGALKITQLGGFQIYRNQPVKPVLQG